MSEDEIQKSQTLSENEKKETAAPSKKHTRRTNLQRAKLAVKWEERQRKQAELLAGKKRCTPLVNQHQLLVLTSLAEQLSEGDKLQSIIEQIKEVDTNVDIVLNVSKEEEVEVEGTKNASEDSNVDEDNGMGTSLELKKAADSILTIHATKEGLQKALLLLAPELHITDSDPPRAAFELRFVVPTHCISLIIGDRGETIIGMRKETSAFIQAYTTSLPISEENVVRVQHMEYEGLVSTVLKLYDIVASAKTSADVVQYKPFWFKQCAYENTGSYTDTFHYERTLTPTYRNTPFFDNSEVLRKTEEKKKRKLEQVRNYMTKNRGAFMTQGPGAKHSRGTLCHQTSMRGSRGAPTQPVMLRNLSAGRGKGLGPQQGRGFAPFSTYHSIYNQGGNEDYSGNGNSSYIDDSYLQGTYIDDGYMEGTYMDTDDSYMEDSYIDDGYKDNQDAFAAGIALGIALASRGGTIGRGLKMSGRSSRGRGIPFRGREIAFRGRELASRDRDSAFRGRGIASIGREIPSRGHNLASIGGRGTRGAGRPQSVWNMGIAARGRGSGSAYLGN